MPSITFHLPGVALAALAAGAATGQPPASSSAGLEPIAFFTGRSAGEGTVDTLLSSPVKLLVESLGRKQGDTLILDQTIREGAKPLRVRRWIMRPVAPGRYTGTLTDAEGPVNVTVAGPQASIRYRMRGGLDVNQQLTLQGDGRTLLNRLQVKKFGVRVAVVEETIRKLD
jgi:Protein of unknown function (DUF3833)